MAPRNLFEELHETDFTFGYSDNGGSLIRCVCGLGHRDQFMIVCDRCETWQHSTCMGICVHTCLPYYLCHRCSPRVLLFTRTTAVNLQFEKIASGMLNGVQQPCSQVFERINFLATLVVYYGNMLTGALNNPS